MRSLPFQDCDELTKALATKITRRDAIKALLTFLISAVGSKASITSPSTQNSPPKQVGYYLRCSIPTNPTDRTCPPDTTYQPTPGFTATANGCVSQNGWVYEIFHVTFPSRYGKVSFLPTCNTH